MKDYNKPHLFPMLLKHNHVFTPCAKMWVCGKSTHDENYNHDILKITMESNEPTKEFMNRKLQIIKIYQIDALK